MSDDEELDEGIYKGVPGMILKGMRGARIDIRDSHFDGVPIILDGTTNASVNGVLFTGVESSGLTVINSEGAGLYNNVSVGRGLAGSQSIGYNLANLIDARVISNSSYANDVGFRANGIKGSIFKDNYANRSGATSTSRIYMKVSDVDELVYLLRSIRRIVMFPYISSIEISRLKLLMDVIIFGVYNHTVFEGGLTAWRRLFSDILESKSRKQLGIYDKDLESLLRRLDRLIHHMYKDVDRP